MTKRRRWLDRSMRVALVAIAGGGVLSACSTPQGDPAYRAAYIRDFTPAREQTGILAASESVGFRDASFHLPAVAAAKSMKSQRLAEDLWIIEAGARENGTCLGTLMGMKGDEKRDVFRLERATIKPTLTGTLATVRITQEFSNASAERIDGAYLLTLPADATPSDFLMTIGDRRIRAIVRDRASAEKLYVAAKGQGLPVTYAKAGSPLSIAVGNIEAGRDVTVSIQYIQPLAVKDGVCTFALGTRDLGKDNAPAEGITLDFAATMGMRIQEAKAPHSLTLSSNQAHAYQGKLNLKEAKDYAATFKIGGKEPQATLMSCRDSSGLYWALSVVAPMDRAARGLMLASRELGEVRLPEVPQGKAILVVGRVDSTRELREPPTLTWGDARVSIPLSQQACTGLPFLWARARHDGLTKPADAKARTQVALEHGLLTEETAVLAVDTTQR